MLKSFVILFCVAFMAEYLDLEVLTGAWWVFVISANFMLNLICYKSKKEKEMKTFKSIVLQLIWVAAVITAVMGLNEGISNIVIAGITVEFLLNVLLLLITFICDPEDVIKFYKKKPTMKSLKSKFVLTCVLVKLLVLCYFGWIGCFIFMLLSTFLTLISIEKAKEVFDEIKTPV